MFQKANLERLFSLSWMEIEKNLSFFFFCGRDTSVWATNLPEQFQRGSGFNSEHENTCLFASHIGSSIPTFRDMYTQLIVWKRKIYNFLHKIDHVYVYQIYKKYPMKISFSFFFFTNFLTTKLDENDLVKKMRFFLSD